MPAAQNDEFTELEAKIAHVIAYARTHGKSVQETLPPIIRLMILFDLAGSGPLLTISAIRGLLEQIDRHFPQSTANVDLLEAEPHGSA